MALLSPAWHRVATMATVAALLPASTGLHAGQEEATYAAFTANFIKFADWPRRGPADPEQTQVCFLSRAEPVATHMAGHEGRILQGRELRLRHATGPADLRACQLLFIGRRDEFRLTETLRAVEGHPVLTLSDIPGAASNGAMIELYLDQGKPRFAIHLERLKASGINLSAQVLKLARIVRD